MIRRKTRCVAAFSPISLAQFCVSSAIMDRVGHGRELGLCLVLVDSFEGWITWITLHNFRGEE